ncbi:hypothetical protein HU200_029426 [Digitaria exilis]|uniref:Uncharacterized protein n=1 Tax=Digitaria exilis TaxID=1010633 RepID=A0A835BUN9_9POAL|nr:hypothetical protein HU200_029426 [Digitaria exilis]
MTGCKLLNKYWSSPSLLIFYSLLPGSYGNFAMLLFLIINIVPISSGSGIFVIKFTSNS